jgi:YVTN family beta-propeller protein
VAEEHRYYHGKYFLTLAFASIFLTSLGMLAHNAFADSVTATISVGTNPSVVAINPTTNRIYVGNSGEGTISVIDGTSNTVLTKIAVSSTAMDINKNTNIIYSISTYSSSISVINGSTNQVVASISTYAGPTGIAVNSNTNEIYVTETGHFINSGPAGFIQVINGTTNTVVKTIDTDISAGNIVVNPNTNKVYFSDAWDGSILVFDGTTYTVTAKIPGITIGALAINPLTNRLYDTYEGNPEIIDTSTNTVLGTFQVGDATIDGVNSATNKIYVGDSGFQGANGNTIYVIDGTTNSIVQRLQVGSDNQNNIAEVQIGVNPNTNKIYVVNLNSNTVSVIDGSSSNNPTLSVAVHANKQSYLQKSAAYFKVTVNSGASPTSGASVTLRECAPNNSCITKTGTTNSNGAAFFEFWIPQNAPVGTYTASATASKSGYTSGSGHTTFQVTYLN